MRHTLILLLALVVSSCGTGDSARYSRKAAQSSLGKLEAPGLTIGEFELTKVTDGDTIHVDGLDSSLRLLGMDTEETFKSEGDRRLFENGWEQYLAAKRGDSKHPVKAATPMGDEAKEWAKQFFDGASHVRLERDDPKEIRDRYGRYLAYVFALKDGKWVNYNVEAVRAGMSPYFSKYGYSRQYHQEFVDAEAEARAAGVGIWDPTKMHYPDYEERFPWWNARADFIEAFRKEAAGRDDYFTLDAFDAVQRLEQMVGKEVAILGLVGDVRLGDRGPTKVMLSRKMFGDFPLVFFDKDVFASTGIAKWRGEFVVARGALQIYENKYNHKKQIQIVVDRPGQITLSPIPGLVAE